MRLRIHIATANEELVALVNEGYDAISAMQAAYQGRKEKDTYNDSKDVDGLVAPVNAWADKVVESLEKSRRCQAIVIKGTHTGLDY